MTDIQVSRSVRKITAVERTESGRSRARNVYKKKLKPRKVSRALRPQEEQARQIVEMYRTFAEDYLARHARSNLRRRDGWYFDYQENVYRAARKALRQYYEEKEEEEDEEEEYEVRDEYEEEEEEEEEED